MRAAPFLKTENVCTTILQTEVFQKMQQADLCLMILNKIPSLLGDTDKDFQEGQFWLETVSSFIFFRPLWHSRANEGRVLSVTAGLGLIVEEPPPLWFSCGKPSVGVSPQPVVAFDLRCVNTQYVQQMIFGIAFLTRKHIDVQIDFSSKIIPASCA